MSTNLRTNTFSPSEAALSVFELAKRQPQFVLRFCIIYALVAMLGFGLMSALGVGEAVKAYLAIVTTDQQPDPEKLLEALSPAFPGLVALMIFGFPTGAITTAMALRKAVRDEDRGFFGLQFGGDEIRLLIATLIMSGILFGVSFGTIMVGSVISFGNMAVGFLTVIAATIAMAIVGTRLGLFGVFAIAENSIGLTASWTQTRGYVMRFIGAFLLWGVVSFIISLVIGLIASIGAGALGAEIRSSVPESLSLFLTPGWLFYTLLSGLASGLTTLGFVCIGAYAWHQMRGDLPPPAQSI
jgi:hypothetical protein